MRTLAAPRLGVATRAERRRPLYVPAWPGLGVEALARGAHHAMPFPFSSPGADYFYRARHAIYHLARSLRLRPDEIVLAPDYHSGNEIAALRAAGASVHLYRIGRDLLPDLDQIDRLARILSPRILFVIHYLGWPQPVRELTSIARSRGMLLVEDCALALLSGTEGRPLGTFGDAAVFCLYKSVPVPNGGLAVRRKPDATPMEPHGRRGGGAVAVAGRTADLFLERLRSRARRTGGAIAFLKRGVGRALRAAGARRAPVGDIGFSLDDLDLRISPLSRGLLERFDYDAIRRRRRDNFIELRNRLDGRARLLRADLADGVCPLFLPLVVKDKRAASEALQRRGIQAIEFWNEGDAVVRPQEGSDARWLRRHVLEVPLHQDVTAAQREHIACEVARIGAL